MVVDRRLVEKGLRALQRHDLTPPMYFVVYRAGDMMDENGKLLGDSVCGIPLVYCGIRVMLHSWGDSGCPVVPVWEYAEDENSLIFEKGYED